MGYVGGKSQAGVYQRIINNLPPHRVYIEPFYGGGAIMRLKRPAQYSIAVDADAAALAAIPADVLARPGVTAICGDGPAYLRDYPWQGDELVYADPPYLFSVRRGGERPYYACEFGTEEEHLDLLTLLLAIPAGVYVCVSGYRSPLYDAMLQSWRRVDYQAVTRGGGAVTESLWCNYPEPMELHDYQYLGTNYREREKIARQKRRWRRRLQNMPTLQRYAMLASLAEFSEGGLQAAPTDESGEGIRNPGSPGGIVVSGAAARISGRPSAELAITDAPTATGK